jgi:hypothetical protein
MREVSELIVKSLQKLQKWVEEHNYKGYEPFDGLSSYLRPLTFGNLFLNRILMQSIRQSPFNLRPFLGISPLDSTIGRGYMAWGYLTLLRYDGNEEYAHKSRHCLEWLIENKSPGYEEYSWGKHFDFVGRGGWYPKNEPITVWTCLIGMAFLEAYDLLGERKYLAVAESICRWILALRRHQMGQGTCLSYTGSGEGNTIHNHNMLAAATLARTARYVPNVEYLHLAKQVIQFSCSCQHPDGGWYYGETPMWHWIDSFHSAYNLDSLKCYLESTGEKEFNNNLRQGFDFYKNHFFEESGRPKYYHNRAYPIDSQCASQAIDTLANFSEYDNKSLVLASKVAKWTIDNMQDKDGHFYYRRYPLIKAKTAMFHWAQATTYKALALLLSKLNSTRDGFS